MAGGRRSLFSNVVGSDLKSEALAKRLRRQVSHVGAAIIQGARDQDEAQTELDHSNRRTAVVPDPRAESHGGPATLENALAPAPAI
jgi:hypothetical protein